MPEMGFSALHSLSHLTLTMTLGNMHLSLYVTNEEWDIIGSRAGLSRTNLPSCKVCSYLLHDQPSSLPKSQSVSAKCIWTLKSKNVWQLYPSHDFWSSISLPIKWEPWSWAKNIWLFRKKSLSSKTDPNSVSTTISWC